MKSQLIALIKRPFFISECFLAGYLFFSLVLAGQRFAKFATLCGIGAAGFFVLEMMLRSKIQTVILNAKPLAFNWLFAIFSVIVLPLIPYAGSRVQTLFTGFIFMLISFTIMRKWGRVAVLEVAFPMVVCLLCFLMFVAPGLVGAQGSTSGGGRVNYTASGLGEGGGLLSSHFSIIVGIAVLLSLRRILEEGFYLKKLLRVEYAFHAFSILLGVYLIVIRSGSRQGTLWLILAAVFCYAVYNRRRIVIGFLTAIPLFLGVVTAAFFIFRNTPTVQRIVDLFDPVKRTFDPEKSVEIRTLMIQIGWDLWKQSPLWGNGNEAFRVKGGFGSYSHNNYIEILANYGMIGFSLFYIPLLAALLISLRGFLNTRHDFLKKDYLWVTFCVVSLLVSHMFMPTYYMKHMVMFLGVLYGYLYFIVEKDRTAPMGMVLRPSPPRR